jgi:hypothetical protein
MSLEEKKNGTSSAPTNSSSNALNSSRTTTSASHMNGSNDKSQAMSLDEIDIDSFIVNDHPEEENGDASSIQYDKINSHLQHQPENTMHNTAVEAPENDTGEGEEPQFRIVVDQGQKQVFEQQKEEIMRTVPNAVKQRFGEIVFATFGSYIGPVLVLNPYHVSPGPVRDQWFKMYAKVSNSPQHSSLVA